MTTSDVYTIDKKRKMASKISDIRNKSDLKLIKSIIFEENPDISVNKDSGGMLMFFQNLTIKTYERLDQLLAMIDKRTSNTNQETSCKYIDKLSDSYNNSNYLTSHTRFRYTNKERSIMRKKEYDEIITDQNNMIINAFKSSDQIMDSDSAKNDESWNRNNLSQLKQDSSKNNSIFSKN